MKTDVVKPKDIFYNPTRLTVPLFQRPYVWSLEEQWAPLWEDIVRLIDVIEDHNPDATHFLGATVIQQVPTRLGALPTWNVIDGQQRMTTLQLLLDALHAQLERRGFTDLAEQVLPLVENPKSFRKAEDDRFKLWPTNRDRASFGAVMAATPPISYGNIPESRLRDAHRFFSEAIGEWLGDDGADQRAALLVGAVTERLEIASIRLEAHEDAQAIFETLNARGTPLSAADLIKNFIFQQVDAAEAEKAYLAYWADFETPWWETEVTSGRIKNPRASLFLWQWLVARTLTDFPIREVFTQFKHYVNTVEKDVAALLPRIKTAADRYRAIIEGSENPNGTLDRTQLFSYRVGTLDSEISRPLLIWLDEPEQAEVSESDRQHILELLESWFVRRALVKAPSQGSNRFIVDMLRELSRRPRQELASAVEGILVANHTAVGYWPGDGELRAALTDTNVYWNYRRSRLRMVLEALEDAKRGYPGVNPLAMGPIVRGKATVEHLMPQKWRAHWPADLDEEQARERDRRVQQLGNLTIVTQALNSKVSNGAWEQKRAHFLASDDVLITKDALALAAGSTWDEDTIAERTDHLITQIAALWPAPAGHVGLDVPPPPPITRASVDVAQLVDAGWLEVGTELDPRLRAVPGAVATVAQDGRLFVDGVAYDTPSAAAAVVYTAKGGVNGWWFWGIAGTDKRLNDVRADYLASLGADAADAGVEADA
ncbi:GmrSD restriction endonuclease domain-containing protein [Microbacterium aurum]